MVIVKNDVVLDDEDDDGNSGEIKVPMCEYLLIMKGAPEVLIKLCSRMRTAQGDQLLHDEVMLDFQV